MLSVSTCIGRMFSTSSGSNNRSKVFRLFSDDREGLVDRPRKEDDWPSPDEPELTEYRRKMCGKNAEPRKVATCAKSFTNERREPFDRGRVCFRDVIFYCQVF